MIDKDLVVNMSFFYKDSVFICFLERLEDYCFVLDEIYIILLYLDSFLSSENNVLDLLLLLLLLLYSLSALIILLIIVIFIAFGIFFFSEKAST